MGNIANVFTTTITGVFTTPEGASEIFIKNSGGGALTITGNQNNFSTGAASTPIPIAAGEAFSYGYVGKGRASIIIDASGTTARISITF